MYVKCWRQCLPGFDIHRPSAKNSIYQWLNLELITSSSANCRSVVYKFYVSIERARKDTTPKCSGNVNANCHEFLGGVKSEGIIRDIKSRCLFMF